MADRGELERLVVRAYTTADYQEPFVGEFRAYVNPAELQLSYEVEYDGAQGAGTTNSRQEFTRMKPGDLSLTFFLDGTGANGRLVSVQDEVETFQRVTGYNGAIHRPNYLKIAWGKLTIRRCVLKSATVAYRLFHPDGVPLRAAITAVFVDNSDDKTRVALQRDQSADLTHQRLVRAGDTLPGLCQEIYGDPLRYVDVARHNGLDGFREIAPGTTLVFPPLQVR